MTSTKSGPSHNQHLSVTAAIVTLTELEYHNHNKEAYCEAWSGTVGHLQHHLLRREAACTLNTSHPNSIGYSLRMRIYFVYFLSTKRTSSCGSNSYSEEEQAKLSILRLENGTNNLNTYSTATSLLGLFLSRWQADTFTVWWAIPVPQPWQWKNVSYQDNPTLLRSHPVLFCKSDRRIRNHRWGQCCSGRGQQQLLSAPRV